MYLPLAILITSVPYSLTVLVTHTISENEKCSLQLGEYL